ncbi:MULTISPECIES: DUF6345 domain-containing protein [unclassified Paracoccus (in: a-proteobacteria)]|uniref:DUF6345 domain-containing protein n=1 Tax=unclassified Paracoccus (in: a-proteobacteria) TaxID=2688777 RepID=UPI0012B33135|nr:MULTISPECIES: DUF6345 domain-containing protein [unclassified Paracoccus (in: a-proteobacteria)]UXU76467.1 DUF6345 domain-containing protein [Paracoccus sp. SMMA_5]UXU82195.1 DUF6345 domain-containing protein [Paracoccus sp. SMMA_5_TC]
MQDLTLCRADSPDADMAQDWPEGLPLIEGEPISGIAGASSLQSYRAAGPLHAAHADAGAFLDGLDAHASADFWRQDANVRAWIYDRIAPAERIASDMDSVRLFYHAGHGRMTGEGEFIVPLGGQGPVPDASIASHRMRLGGKSLRYLFWAASESVAVSGGRDPRHAWSTAIDGLRMMFGLDGTAWDSPGYGAGFWRHLGLGKSFSQAWLDGAAEVAAAQTPAVLACGDTPEAARDALFHERRFHAGRARAEWWAWRWLQPMASELRAPAPVPSATAMPALRLRPARQDLALIRQVMQRLDIAPGALSAEGTLHLRRDDLRLQRQADGRILLEMLRPPRPSVAGMGLKRRALVAQARAALRSFGFLPGEHALLFDGIHLSLSACGRRYDSCTPAQPQLDEIVVSFRQAVEGVAFLAEDAGWLRVVLRPDGRLVRIECKLRGVASRLDGHGREARVAPEPDQAVNMMLAQQTAMLMRELAARGAAPLRQKVLPGSTQIGYGLRANTARPIARQAVEVECARGFRKRYWIQSDLGD